MFFIVALIVMSVLLYLSARLSMRFYRWLSGKKIHRAGAALGSIVFCSISFICGTAALASLFGVSALYGCSYF